MASRNSGLRIHSGTAESVRTEVTTVASIISATALTGNPSLLTIDQASKPAVSTPGLSWKTYESAYLGWPTLIALSGTGDIIATAPAQWREKWRAPKESSVFDREPWPPQDLVAEVADLNAELFAPASIARSIAVQFEVGLPGCPPEMVHAVDRDLVKTPSTVATFPTIPARVLRGFKPATTINVDLAKQDLGKLLADPGLPDSAHVIATGFGIKRSESHRLEREE